MTDTETVDTTTHVDDTDNPPADEPKTWTPLTEAEVRALQAKVKKANAEAASHRKQADELRRNGETETDAKVREAIEKAAADADGRWKPRYVRQSAKAALVEAGLIGSPDRLLKLIDNDHVDVDDEGDITGLDDQIRALKKDYPELFAKRGSARIDGADRGDVGRPQDADERRRLKMLKDAGLA